MWQDFEQKYQYCSACTLSFIKGLFLASELPVGPRSSHSRGFYVTHNDAPQSVGLLWTSDQLVTKTST